MIGRRDILLGGIMLASAGLAAGLKPRREVRLLRKADLAAFVPLRFAGWNAIDGGDFVLPRTEGSLGDTLYGDELSRVYRNPAGERVMLMMAYGQLQSDMLQLHRPESCYPALGFTVSRSEPIDLMAGPGRIAAVQLTARRGERVEDIVYWSRLGEYLPQNAAAQREARLRIALAGEIGDGILVRASIIRNAGDPPGHALLRQFLGGLVLAVPQRDRAGLIGTRRTAQIA